MQQTPFHCETTNGSAPCMIIGCWHDFHDRFNTSRLACPGNIIFAGCAATSFGSLLDRRRLNRVRAVSDSPDLTSCPDIVYERMKKPEEKKLARTLPLLQRILTTMLLISCLAVNGISSSHDHQQADVENMEEACPPCNILFGKLEKTGRHGKLSQDVRVQERGEPKSGTGVMFYWATASLIHTCDYLQDVFGEETYPQILVGTQAYRSPENGMYMWLY